MPDTQPETEECTPSHLVITLVNGMSSPVLRIDEHTSWWWIEDGNCLMVGPNEDCPNPDEYAFILVPRENIAMLQTSVCKCDHNIANEASEWLARVMDGFNPFPSPPQSGEGDNSESQ